MLEVKRLSESIKLSNSKMIQSHDFSVSQKTFSYRHCLCPSHPQNYIVNFCQNPECLKPLCAECIRSHAKEHQEKSTHGQFETIEEISEKCYQSILKVRQMYKEQQYSIYNQQQELENQEYILREKLKIAKDKIYQTVDLYFKQVEKDLIGNSKRQKTKQQNEMNQIIRKINDCEEELQQMYQKMTTPQFTKQVIQFLSQPYEENAKLIALELEKTNKMLEDQLLDVLFDENKVSALENNLQGYIKLYNSDYYPDIGNSQMLQSTSVQKESKVKEKKKKDKKEKKEQQYSVVNDQQSKKDKDKKGKKKEQNMKALQVNYSQSHFQMPQQQSQQLYSPMVGRSMVQLAPQNQQQLVSSNFGQFQQSRSIVFR